MDYPKDLVFAKTHEWLRQNDDGSFSVGISAHATAEMGDLVYVGLPEEGQSFAAGETFGEVESVKAVSSVFLPVAGEILEINSALDDQPELINETPFEAWMVRIKAEGEPQGLLSAEEYQAFLAEESL